MIFPAPKCYECSHKLDHKLKCSKYPEIPIDIIRGGPCEFYVEIATGGTGAIPG
jgi:hypothetical protein